MYKITFLNLSTLSWKVKDNGLAYSFKDGTKVKIHSKTKPPLLPSPLGLSFEQRNIKLPRCKLCLVYKAFSSSTKTRVKSFQSRIRLFIYLCMYSFSCKEKQNFNHSVIFGPKVKVNNKTIFRLRSAFSVLVKFSKLNFLVVTASCWVAKNKSCPNNIKRKYIRPRHKTDSLAILKWLILC